MIIFVIKLWIFIGNVCLYIFFGKIDYNNGDFLIDILWKEVWFNREDKFMNNVDDFFEYVW